MKTQFHLFTLTCFALLFGGMPAAEELPLSLPSVPITAQTQVALDSDEPLQLAYYPYYDDDDDEAYDRYQGRRITCESRGERYTYCPTNIHGRIRLERQLSDAPCREYHTWGADGDGGGIWVREGCRGIFMVESRWARDGRRGHYDRETVTCKSKGFNANYCPTGTRGRVRLERQLSDAPCREYYTWGADGDGSGIWVDQGCSAEFAIY